MSRQETAQPSASRRDFLKTSGAAPAGTTLPSAIAARGYAAEDNTIKIALVGCGGRGTGAAAQALSTQGPTQLWAVADVFDSRLQSSLRNVAKQLAKPVAVPPDRQFVGHGRLQESHRHARPGRRRHSGHAAGLPADPPGVRRAEGHECLHGEVVRGRCPRHPPRAPRGPGGRARKTSKSPAA